MSRLMRKLMLAAAVVGVAGGSVAAIAVPQTRPAASSPAPREAPQRPLPRHQTAMELVQGTMHIDLRRDDPGGGPAWAIRSFGVVRAGHSLRTELHCQQIGRVVKGRFGWIDGSNVFRPAGVNAVPSGGAPGLCERSVAGPHKPVQIDARTLVMDIDGERPRFGTSFAWGFGGAGTKRVELRVGARRTRPAVSGRGAFLAFLPKPVRRSQVSAVFTYAGGVTNRVTRESQGFIPPMPAGLPQPSAGPVRLLARAPDPAGGLPYALGGVRARGGGWCLTQPQRVVDERAGAVDLDLGTFIEVYVPTVQCQGKNDPGLRRHAVGEVYQFGGGAVENEGDAARLARITRRTQPGTTIISGAARADVRSITITTPRDVRTLVPTSPAHAFIAVYDGGFPTGKIVTTAHFADGTSRVADSFVVGGL